MKAFCTAYLIGNDSLLGTCWPMVIAELHLRGLRHHSHDCRLHCQTGRKPLCRSFAPPRGLVGVFRGVVDRWAGNRDDVMMTTVYVRRRVVAIKQSTAVSIYARYYL